MRNSAAITQRSAGFTLAELAVSLAIIGFLLFLLLPTSSVMLSNSHRAATLQKLSNLDQALVNFVIVNKRLPCPADGSLSTGTEVRDTASGDCSPGNQDKGVVPWVTLGLGANDIIDAWNNRITYRVGYGLTHSGGMDMSSCDPAGTGTANNGSATAINTGVCNSSSCVGTFIASNCTKPSEFLAFKGLNVESGISPVVTVMDFTLSTGAAYVLISHGDNGYGAYSINGVYQTPPADWRARTPGSTLEDLNWNSGHTVANGAPPVFADAAFSDSSDEIAHFDDMVMRPTLFSVISRAQLGPRSH